jgi:putative membrane protein insertion efficiency factor
MTAAVLRVPRRAVTGLVHAYQRGISPYTPPSCRYSPVCSQYAVDAVARHGVLKGVVLACGRILRCNPFARGGADPVPAPGMWTNPRVDTEHRRSVDHDPDPGNRWGGPAARGPA